MMQVEITDSIDPNKVGTSIRASKMKAGDYGIILDESHCARIYVDEVVYRHIDKGPILNMCRPSEGWEYGGNLRVRLLEPGKSITITRTE